MAGGRSYRLQCSFYPTKGNDQLVSVFTVLVGTHYLTTTEIVAEFCLLFLLSIHYPPLNLPNQAAQIVRVQARRDFQQFFQFGLVEGSQI
ncbi:hypothetical protein shn_12795 [Shinella sp. HZN7]|nr:hypothetical protein shn_12795 [Shinella sp. HZN7]